MVCIAAFIILCLISVVVAFLSIFKRDIGAKWWKVFKKAWHCVFKKVRLQKCDTNFKDDVKNSILRKVIVKKPKWVKPLSILIEVISVLIVIITVWSIVIAIKSLLALWVFGTCNVSQPSQCSLGAEVCSIDADEPTTLWGKIGRGIGEWGQIFGAIPDRLKDWKVEDISVYPAFVASDTGKELALSVIDPGCSVCMQSYKNLQADSEFLANHTLYVAIYPIELPDGGYKFKNSGIITRYIYATVIYQQEQLAKDKSATAAEVYRYSQSIIARIFTESNKKGINYQSVFNNELDSDQAVELLESWLTEWGASVDDVARIRELTDSEQVANAIKQTKDAVDSQIHAKGIPVMIYDGRKHDGLYK